jgi:hypothetical protein
MALADGQVRCHASPPLQTQFNGRPVRPGARTDSSTRAASPRKPVRLVRRKFPRLQVAGGCAAGGEGHAGQQESQQKGQVVV